MSNSAQNLLQVITGTTQPHGDLPGITLEQLDLPSAMSARRAQRILVKSQLMLDLFNAFGTTSTFPDGSPVDLTSPNDVRFVVLYNYDDVNYFRTISQLDVLVSTVITIATFARCHTAAVSESRYARSLGFEELMYVTDLLAEAIGPFGKHEIFELDAKNAACGIVNVFGMDPPAVAALLNSSTSLKERVASITYVDATDSSGLGEYLINAGTRKIEQSLRRLCAIKFRVMRYNVAQHPDFSDIKAELKQYC